MKPEQKMGMIFSAFGLAMGVLSAQIGPGFLSYVAPVAAYAAMLFLAGRLFKEKKAKWLLTHSIMSFLLVWVVSWVIFFNIAGGPVAA